MDNYKGIYFNNAKTQKFYEAGAHFNYKDLYDKLLEIYNKRNKFYLPQKVYNLNLSPTKTKRNCNENIVDNKKKIIIKGNSSTASKKKTRNKKIATNYSNSDYSDNNNYKNINLNILQKSIKSIDNNYYNEHNNIKNSTGRIIDNNQKMQNAHHNSINKNYIFTKRKKSKMNLSVANKDKQNSMNIKYNPINKSIVKKKNNSNKNNTIYNYSYLNFENNYYKKMKKMKTNNQKNKNIFNIGIYKYNLYDNIFLKNKIKNRLKQYKQNKYNSFIKENSINKNSVSSTKINEKSKNKYISSIDKNLNEKNKINTKRELNHIKSINYASIYIGLNNNKTPTHKKLYNESIYNIKTVLNKKDNKKYPDFINNMNKNQTSYAKIKKSQLSLSKRMHNKEIIVKERLKRDTQSTEYE